MERLGNLLEKSFQDWQPPEKEVRYCPHCNSRMNANKQEYKFLNGKRFIYTYSCPKDCEKKIEAKKEYAKRYRNAKKAWENVGFSRECVGWTLEKMTCENIVFLREYADNFNKSSKSLLLRGYKGTGKSLSSECIAKKLLKKGFSVKITNMTEINIEMNFALRKDTYKEYLEKITGYDLIIIDDFGREQYNTEKSLENVFQFFNTLTKKHKAFIVSVNPEMLATISEKPQLDACIDRFKKSSRTVILNFVGNSFRN